MGHFNTKLVESLDFLNKVLAVIFASMAVFKFYDLFTESILNAAYESMMVIGVGILTCGYIAVVININTNVEKIHKLLDKDI